MLLYLAIFADAGILFALVLAGINDLMDQTFDSLSSRRGS